MSTIEYCEKFEREGITQEEIQKMFKFYENNKKVFKDFEEAVESYKKYLRTT